MDIQKLSKEEKHCIASVWKHYSRYGRHTLPWRKNIKPYSILVSEIMLQQTQVERVHPKYRAFIRQFPSVRRLARASLGEVLILWQGLGYNRRAKLLHRAAQVLDTTSGGRFPRTYDALVQLPGVGPYTANALLAFAYNEPVHMIETNIRSVYLHHFYPTATDVPDTEIMMLILRTLDRERPREWYWALMDYGSHLKKTYGNPNSRSVSYTKQSAFKGSDREIRGALLRLCVAGACTRETIRMKLPFDAVRIDMQLEALLAEGLLIVRGRNYRVPL